MMSRPESLRRYFARQSDLWTRNAMRALTGAMVADTPLGLAICSSLEWMEIVDLNSLRPFCIAAFELTGPDNKHGRVDA